MEWNTGQIYNFGKRNVFRFHLNESRDDFSWRGRRRSFHDDGLKTAKVQEPAVDSVVQGIWRLRVSEAGWSVKYEM